MSFVTVATTGIYCRTGCPVPAPKAVNTGSVPTVDAARAAGYRACKRCRPNEAPTAVVLATGPHATGQAGRGPAELDVVLPHRGRRKLEALFAFLGDRAIPGVEETTDRGLTRSLRLANGPGVVRVGLDGARVRCHAWVQDARDAAEAVAAVRALLDLDRDLRSIEADLLADPELARLMKGRRGTAVPGTVDGFELAVRAILGQQVSVPGARTLAGRLVELSGDDLPGPARTLGVRRVFPAPERLAEAATALAIGMPGTRADAVLTLARWVSAGDLDLSPSASPAAVRDRLLAIPGIGPWTAGYVTMRAQHDPDAFLGTDLGVRKAMAAMGVPDDSPAIEQRAERWRPWRAYAQQYLWASLAPSGRATRQRDRAERAPAVRAAG